MTRGEVTPHADDWLGAIAAGDPDAFARWVASAEPRIRASLRSFAAHVDAEAVVQETLLRVWQVAPRYPGDGRPAGLLRLSIRIARNLAVSELRRRRVEPAAIEALALAAEQIDAGEGPAGADPDLRRIIERCRELLPSRPAAALAARLDGPGEPDRALCGRVGMRLNTFLQNITRARRFLAECLRKNGVDLELWIS